MINECKDIYLAHIDAIAPYKMSEGVYSALYILLVSKRLTAVCDGIVQPALCEWLLVMYI